MNKFTLTSKRSLNIFISYASDCLTDHLPHGEGLLCFSWIKALLDLGHKVTAVSANPNIKVMPEGLTVIQFTPPFSLRSLFPLGCGIYSYLCFRRLHSKQNFDLVWRLYPYGISAPLIPHGRLPYVIGPLYASYTAASLIEKSRFGLKPNEIIMFFTSRIWSKNFYQSSHLFTESCSLASDIRQVYPEEIKAVSCLRAIVTVPENFKAPRTAQFLQGPLRLIFVGHFHPSKRLLNFIEIVNYLYNKGIDVEAKVAGTGEQEAEAKHYVEQLGISHLVTFVGVVNNDNIPHFMASADILISLRRETYGRAICEAMAVGTVPIVHSLYTARELITHGENGFLSDNGYIEDYISVIEKIYKEPDEWMRISKNAQTTAQDWTSKVVGTFLERQFKSLINDIH